MIQIPEVGTTVHFRLANGRCRPALVTESFAEETPDLVVTLNGPAEADTGLILSADRLHGWIPGAHKGQNVLCWHPIDECTPHSPEGVRVAPLSETPAAPQEGSEQVAVSGDS